MQKSKKVNWYRIIIGILFLIIILLFSLFDNGFEKSNVVFIILLGIGAIFSFITGVKRIISDNLYKIILGIFFIIGYIVILILENKIEIRDIILLSLLIFVTSVNVKDRINK